MNTIVTERAKRHAIRDLGERLCKAFDFTMLFLHYDDISSTAYGSGWVFWIKERGLFGRLIAKVGIRKVSVVIDGDIHDQALLEKIGSWMELHTSKRADVWLR